MDTMIEQEIKSRNAIIAFILSLLAPGLGQLYNGQVKKAILFLAGILVYATSISLLHLNSHFTVFLIAFILLVVALLLIAFEAARTARKQKYYYVKKFNKWYVYLLMIAVSWVAVTVCEKIASTTRYRQFKVASGSGMPNIYPGDNVLGDFGIYDTQDPAYGDLVVVLMPDGNNYTYRIVGMPNDTLRIEKSLLKFKNKESTSEYISDFSFEDFEMERLAETLPNGVKYHILRNKEYYGEDREVIVPENAYYLLGDNRGNALDSSYWGAVTREQIKGKLIAIYYSKDLKRINIKL